MSIERYKDPVERLTPEERLGLRARPRIDKPLELRRPVDAGGERSAPWPTGWADRTPQRGGT